MFADRTPGNFMRAPRRSARPVRAPGHSGSVAASVVLAILLLFAPSPALSAKPENDKPAQAADDPDVEPAGEENRPKAWYRSLVPLPVIITEPAIGEGLGIALAYFHPEKAGGYRPRRLEDPTTMRDIGIARKPPPTVTGMFASSARRLHEAAP